MQKYQEKYQLSDLNGCNSEFLEEQGESLCEEFKSEICERLNDKVFLDSCLDDLLYEMSFDFADIDNPSLFASAYQLYQEGFLDEELFQIGNQVNNFPQFLRQCQSFAYSNCLLENLDSVIKNVVYENLFEKSVEIDDGVIC